MCEWCGDELGGCDVIQRAELDRDIGSAVTASLISLLHGGIPYFRCNGRCSISDAAFRMQHFQMQRAVGARTLLRPSGKPITIVLSDELGSMNWDQRKIKRVNACSRHEWLRVP
jgi:hypothetical protein